MIWCQAAIVTGKDVFARDQNSLYISACHLFHRSFKGRKCAAKIGICNPRGCAKESNCVNKINTYNIHDVYIYIYDIYISHTYTYCIIYEKIQINTCIYIYIIFHYIHLDNFFFCWSLLVVDSIPSPLTIFPSPGKIVRCTSCRKRHAVICQSVSTHLKKEYHSNRIISLGMSKSKKNLWNHSPRECIATGQDLFYAPSSSHLGGDILPLCDLEWQYSII